MSENARLWEHLGAMASAYEQVNGVRPNRLRVGRLVAEILEPQRGAHPLHLEWHNPAGGVWFPERPERLPSWWHQVKRQHDCRKAGGHWWHPADAMILWFCCRCGADRDGMPRDGT